MLQGQPTDPRHIHVPVLKTDTQHDLAAQFRTTESGRNRKERSKGQHSGFINSLRKTWCFGFPQFVHVNAGTVAQISRREAPDTLVTGGGQPPTALQALLDATPPRVCAVRSEPTGSDTKPFTINDTVHSELLPAYMQTGYPPPQAPPTLLSQQHQGPFSRYLLCPRMKTTTAEVKNTWSYSSTVLRLLCLATHGGGAAGRAMGQRCQATERQTRC